MNRIAQILLAGLTVVGLVVHALTFAGYDPRHLSRGVWYGLQVTAVLALILALVVFGFKGKTKPPPASWSRDQVVAFVFIAFVAYAVFNFLFTSIVLLHGGSPEIVNGQYSIGSHGFFTTISKDEFLKYSVYEARLHSGHWMAFFLFAFTALCWRTGRITNSSGREP